MNFWNRVDQVSVPDAGVMELLRRGETDEFAIRVDGRELMNSRVHGSEEALADLACDRLGRDGVRVLVGGLGMGFTLAAALRRVGPEGSVVVAELVPGVVAWNRGPLGVAAGRPLDDPRAEVRVGDVADAIRSGGWDAILLDVDNGPEGLTRPSNGALYTARGLDALFDALRPGGVLAVWSAAPDNGFTRRVERAGFDVEVVPVRARGAKGGHRHVIWCATRRATGAAWRGR